MASLATSRQAVVGLDIEPSHVAAAQVQGSSMAVERAATTTLGPGIVRDGEVVDVDALAVALKSFFREAKLPRRVRLGVANQRIVVRTIELPPLQGKELEAAVRFQAAELLPMPIEQAVLDFHVLGDATGSQGPRRRVILVAARRDTIDRMMSAARRAGLRPVGIDLASFAMIRALSTDGSPTIYVNVAGLTNIALAEGPTCLFTRVVAGGFEGMAGDLADRCGLTLEHARQWLGHVGLTSPMEDVTGDASIVGEARSVLADGARRIADEARNSLDFYRSQYGALDVQRAVLTGPVSAVEGFTDELSAGMGLPVEPGLIAEGRPGALEGVDRERVAVAAGLAVEERTP
jgi:type IV pilus assembly protein PilM